MDKEFLWEDKKHWLWWAFSFTRYKLSTKKLYVESGLFSTNYDETLLYRIVDCKCTINLIQRLCGTGTIFLIGIDKTNPVTILQNVKKPLLVKELISELAIQDRKSNGLVEFA